MELRPRPARHCPICLETDLDGDQEWTVWECGHAIHTSCALQSALKGNITCAVCRSLLAEDSEEVEELRDRAIYRAWQGRRERSLQRALRMKKRARPAPLNRAIDAYKRAQERLVAVRREKALKLVAIRNQKRALVSNGFNVTLSRSFKCRVEHAMNALRCARQYVQDEMLIYEL